MQLQYDVSEAEKRHLDEVLAAMRREYEFEGASNSEIMTPLFLKDFTTTLLVNHYYVKSPLNLGSFEEAFARAAVATDFSVSASSVGQRFWDIKLNGRQLSLKSSSAKDMKQNQIHISKLCEAAWIQDMRMASQRERQTKELFASFRSLVDAIIMLSFFRSRGIYELIEIPGTIFDAVQSTRTEDFRADGPSIGIPVGSSPPDFILKLDRSDAKITLASIRLGNCIVHGRWKLK